MRSLSRAIVLAALLALTVACDRGPARESGSAAQEGQMESWSQFTNRFIEEYMRAQPLFAVDTGRHEFDGQAPDWSAAGFEKDHAWLRSQRAAAERFPEDALTPEERFEREYLLWVIDNRLFWEEKAQAPFRNPAWYISRLDPDVYLSREYAPLEERMQAYIEYASAVPRLAANIRANLRTPMPRTFVERGISGFGGYAEFFRNDVPKVFESVQNPELQKRLKEVNEAAAKAMDELRAWLESERKNATDGFALGEDLFLEMLRQTERVDVSIEQLVAAGEADLERNLQALREACARYLPKGTLNACVEKMAANKPEGGAVEGARAQLESLRQFVADKQLVSIPTEEQAHVAESPPHNRANSAYINIPGPYEKPSVAWTYYISPPDPSWTPEERAAYIPGEADLLFTSIHEVWPGHFLQFKHANRNPSKIAALWVSYAFGEGWAHYTEELMWEAGLGHGDPELHIGQLTNALLRNVRYISAIGMHVQGMTLEESERLFREKAFADPGNARQQAARGTYDPAYLNYTLGKLMIRKLREDWLEANPPASGADPRMAWRAFHDELLSYGGPPIPLVRKQMVGEGGAPL